MPSDAKLTIDGKTYSLPIVEGTEGERALDITSLRSETGLTALDPAYGNTASCTSGITVIGGDRGILRYRGIPLEEFADKPNFVEVAWLLIFGKLPNSSEYQQFSQRLTNHANLDEDMKHHFMGFPRSAPPMAILSAMISTLSCFHPQLLELHTSDEIEAAAARLISKIRTLAAYTYRHSHGLPYIYPDPSLPYTSNFLHMMFSEPYKRYESSEEVRRALNLVLILHADHEQNCSTSTVRMVGSSRANLFASCAAGVSALWGPLHGGANVKVIEMLEAIHQGNQSADEFINLSKDKSSGIRLMGFGHRIYKNFDPRAMMLRKVCDEMLDTLGIHDPLLDIAKRLEDIALNDEYFVSRKLYPNVDFYSGIILRAIGIPTNMFTVLFAIGRLPGWIAHWHEQNSDPNMRISRPRQIYTGNPKSPYIDVRDRT
ncbi:MAG: citrate synthase [Gammaproteobacteria bacterium]|nr:citrate synthase [Gammaproteobacteria bacterium]